MSTDYSYVKPKKLKLKGEKSSHKKHKSKKRKHNNDDGGSQSEQNIEAMKNGGWWKTSSFSEVTGNVAIEIGGMRSYIRAMDNGMFTVGAPHDEGDGPAPEEIFTVVPGGIEDKIALKSGYDKYLGITTSGRVTGCADAVGSQELWQPVFQEGKTAILAANDCFISVDEDDNIVARSRTASDGEMLVIRSNNQNEKDKKEEMPEAEKGSLRDVEKNYVKMFQKFQDKKTKLSNEGIKDLKAAKSGGTLHEALLNRRSKLKADRYCK